MSPERPLGSVHVAAVVVGAIVGVGIFFTPATLARGLPGPAWVLGVWLLGGVVSVAGALVFAALSARYPRAGGVYVFLREGFGPRAGPPLAFLYGWLALLVVQPGSMAVIAIVLVDHVAYLTGPPSPALRTGGAALAIAAFTLANLLGLRTGGRIQVVMAALKLGALALIIAAGALWGSADRLIAARGVAVEGSPLSWILLGLIPVLFTFGGAYQGTYIAGSVRDPERSVPRGILAGIALVVVGYLGVNAAYLGLLGHDRLAASASPAAEAAALVLGPLAGKAVAVAVVLSAAGILNTVCLAFPFVVYAMARDGVFFARAGQLDARTGRPAVAVALQGALASAAVLAGSARVDVILMSIAFADALFQAAAAVVLLRVRRRALAAWIFLVLELGVAIACLARRPVESAYSAFMILAGAGAWRLWRRAGYAAPR
jgi:basic amino acid/polyamine antiporter, APA family